jgi:CRISPR-associated protein Cas6
MPMIDLAFTLQGTTIPQDHGYALFGALSRIVPQLHGEKRIGVHPIRGIHTAPGRLTLVPGSKLRLRLPSEEIAPYLALAGTSLDLDGSRLRVGIPRAESLIPAPNLTSRLVIYPRLTDPKQVLDSARKQLQYHQIAAQPELIPSTDPRTEGQPARRVLRIKGRKIVGYALRVAGLTAEESIRLQGAGLGGRRRFGCGVFVPSLPRSR